MKLVIEVERDVPGSDFLKAIQRIDTGVSTYDDHNRERDVLVFTDSREAVEWCLETARRIEQTTGVHDRVGY